MIEAIVLAAGQSRRMRRPKPLLRFGDTTFLGQIVSVLRRCDVDGITVVLGAAAQEIRTAVDLSGVDVVMNEVYEKGQLSSLIAGLKHVGLETEAILLCLVDHPLVTKEAVNQVILAFAETHKPIVIPTFGGRRGHPTLFARSVFDELMNAPVEEGARRVVRAHAERVLEVEVPDRGILMSMNTPQDYIACLGADPGMSGTGEER